jgi:hypothetical protein
MAASIRIFRYLPDLDAFVASDEYQRIADLLGLTEWHPAVWIGRLFIMDNDFGEHWFDNWELCEPLQSRAAELGIEIDQLLVVDPERFANGRDGPCHDPNVRKQFWSDVLRSLELSPDLLFDEARRMNAVMQRNCPHEFIADLEDRISMVRAELEFSSKRLG